ncbi:MAG: 30S ribosomal protein S16 [candidate division SR1 bacterium]|nr:30S ribosomal protein S16 [candidate division SR1 bacterium]
MLTIRFQPVGRKHSKMYRVVVAEKTRSVSKKVKENLGWYNPHTKESKLNEDRIKFFVENNVEISESAFSLFKKQGLVK